MPGDEFKQVLQGHRQAISARAWNAVLRTQAEAKDHAHDIAANLSQGPRSQTLVLLQNNSGANRAQFDVLGISAPIILPSVNLNEFQRQVALVGILPDFTSSGRFVLCYDAIRAGEIGRAVIDGVTPGRLLVTPTTVGLSCADVVDGDATHLQLAAGGSAQVLWHDTADFGSGGGSGGTSGVVVDAIFRVGPTVCGGGGEGGGGPIINVLTKACPVFATVDGVRVMTDIVNEFTPVQLPVGSVVFPPSCVEDPSDCCDGHGSGSAPTCCEGTTLPASGCLRFPTSSWAPLAGLEVPLTLAAGSPPSYLGSATFATPGCTGQPTATIHVTVACSVGLGGTILGWSATFQMTLASGSVEAVVSTSAGILGSQNVAVMTCSPFTFDTIAPAFWQGSSSSSLYPPGPCRPCTAENVALYGCTADTFTVSVVAGTCSGSGGGGGGGIASSPLGTATGTGSAIKTGVTVDAGTVLVVLAGCTDARTIAGVTFAGVALAPAITEVLGVDCEIWYLHVTATTTGSVAATTSDGTGLIQFTAREVSGLALAVLDQTSGDIQNTVGDPPFTGPTDPTTHASEFALAGAMYIGAAVSGASWSASGYTDGQIISTTVGSITYTLTEGWQILSLLGAMPAGTYDTPGGGVRPPSWAAAEATFA